MHSAAYDAAIQKSSKEPCVGSNAQKGVCIMSEQSNQAAMAALTDDQLGDVQGGKQYHHDTNTGKYYKWVGSDWNSAYLCPNCGKPVHEGWGWRFYCDDCDESWFYESNFSTSLNLATNCWQEITQAEYDSGTGGNKNSLR